MFIACFGTAGNDVRIPQNRYTNSEEICNSFVDLQRSSTDRSRIDAKGIKQMEPPPLVSVLVTVYDRIGFLRFALQSILEQTFPSFEIIVTDDANNPEIKSICDSFRQRKIRYRSNASPLGVAQNLRVAISQTRGRYIAILNDDDVWEPDFLKLLVAPLENSPERILAFGDHWIMLEDGRIDVNQTAENTDRYRRKTLPEGEMRDWQVQAVLENTIPLAMAAMFRKDAVNWDLLVEDVAGAYDFWISCLLASCGRPAYYVPRRLSRYRVHSSMETARTAADKNENMIFIYGRLIELNLFPQLEAALRRRYRDALFVCGRDYLLFNRLSKAREYFLQSLKTCLNAKALGGLMLTCLPRRFRTVCLRALTQQRTGELV
jgi:glycosyltransferase involved in cell wall biosynthesis